MDRNYIDRHLVVDRYLQGKLDDGELAEFEERLAWDEGLLEEVELATKLREGLRAQYADSEYTATDDARGARLLRWFAQPQYAAAASFLVGVTLATLLMIGDSGPVATVPTAGMRTDVVSLDVLRGTGAPTISVDRDAWTVLLIEAPDTNASYRVTISTARPSGKEVSVQAGLAPSFGGAIALGVPGGVLPPDAYVLTLERRSGAEGADTYDLVQQIPFEVVPAS